MQERKDNIKFQLKTTLNVEIERLRKLMMNVPRNRHTNVRSKVKCTGKMIVQECINKVNGKLQNKVWKPGELNLIATKAKQQQERMKYQLKFKVWHPGGLVVQSL